MNALAEALANDDDKRRRLRADVLLDQFDDDTAATLTAALNDLTVTASELSRAVKRATGQTLSCTAIESWRERHDITR